MSETSGVSVVSSDLARFLPRRDRAPTWSERSWVRARVECATDGVWFVARPTGDGDRGDGPPADGRARNKVKKMLAALAAASFAPTDWSTVAFPPRVPCPHHGEGGTREDPRYRCDGCDARGLVEHDERKGCLGHPCEDCDGKGWVPVGSACDECDADSIGWPRGASVRVGGVVVAAHYADCLRALGAEVATKAIVLFDTPCLVFRVGAVRGLVAGLKT